MSKPTTLLAFLLFLGASVRGQNLVNNYSLETYSPCPTTASQINYAAPWNASRNSPEYLNACSASIYSTVPTNYFGYQPAATGNAYGGGLMYGSFAGSYLADLREFFYVTLSTPLTIGTTYYVSLKVNLCDNSEYAVNNIGVQFCNTYNVNFPLNNTAHVYTTSIISDKVNWVTITGSFVPSVAYNALMIGNFFQDINCAVTFVGSSVDIGYNGYYFVDDVVVSTTPIILPVSWTTTDVKVNGAEARLSWQLEGETPQQFQIEQSSGGKDFAAVASVAAQSSTTIFEKALPLPGESLTLFRIRAVMADGSTHLSPVVEARRNDSDIDWLRLWPSIVNRGEEVSVEVHSTSGRQAQLMITSPDGRQVQSHSLSSPTAGFQQLNLSTQDLAPGAYWISAGSLVRKLMVE